MRPGVRWTTRCARALTLTLTLALTLTLSLTLTLPLTLTLAVPYALHEQVSQGVSGE